MSSKIYWIPRHHIDSFCRHESHKVQGKVLDFGCGSRPYQWIFSHSTDYVGIEYDSSIQEGDHFLRDGIWYYDGLTLPFPDCTFDSVVSFQVIEHVSNIQLSLHELYRVARPGAFILLTCPLIWPEHETPFDYRRFTRWGLTSLLSAAGFSVNTVIPLGTIYDVVSVLILDHLNTHHSRTARRVAKLLAPPLNLFSTLACKVDRWSSRPDRYCYLDLAIIASKAA
jgi:SAM-dependent methyltransferase